MIVLNEEIDSSVFVFGISDWFNIGLVGRSVVKVRVFSEDLINRISLTHISRLIMKCTSITFIRHFIIPLKIIEIPGDATTDETLGPITSYRVEIVSFAWTTNGSSNTMLVEYVVSVIRTGKRNDVNCVMMSASDISLLRAARFTSCDVEPKN